MKKILLLISVTACALLQPSMAETVQSALRSSSATLRPKRKMDVLEYEIGVEIGSRAFLAKSSYKGDLKTAQGIAEGMMKNLDRRYLRGSGIKHRLGTVKIRTDAKTDPLRDKITSTGASGNARGSLAAFKDYWNSHPKEVGKTHDLAVYHVKSAPSGLSYPNSVGSSRRYVTCGGNGATSWANGTLVHEFGHSWGLKHNNSSGMFYESKPRNFKGSHKAGGKECHVSVMHGGGAHNIGRLSTEEANKAYETRQKKRKYGDLVKNPEPIPPFGQYDQAVIVDGKPIKIDVIENDFDCNNDVLDVMLLDTVSQQGGKVTLSARTGPGHRNLLVYTPPAGFVGKDFFHYTVFDKAGLTDWGAVYVTVDGPRVVDTKKTSFNYDLGPAGSPIESGWMLLSPETRGEVFWSGREIEALDRGDVANKINRDLIYGRGPTMLHHKIGNGLWEVTLNMGDKTEDHDHMIVIAEGNTLGTGVASAAGKFPYVQGKVAVTDGELTLQFHDQGGNDPNWVATRLSLTRVGDLPTRINTRANVFGYDLGPVGSPVKSGWAAITPGTTGDIYWSGDAVTARDRKASDDVNRDFIQASGTSALNHKIANGEWMVALSMGDADHAHGPMSIRAEGELISDKIVSPAGQFVFVDENGASEKPAFFVVNVTDGELNLEFSDKDAQDANWVLSRLSLKRR